MTERVSGKTRLLGVMGYPVRHTLSPRIHNASFEAEGLDFVYLPLEVHPRDLETAVAGAVSMGFRGFNLTMPHKEEVVPLLDALDAAAEVTGAVNTVVVDRTPGESPRLRGYNTDGSGMVAACEEAGAKVSGGRVALLGAGGAASAVALAMQSRGARELLVLNRNRNRAARLRERLENAGLGEGCSVLPPESLGEIAPGLDLVINATPLGMNDGDPLPVKVDLLDESTVVSDAVYRPGKVTRLVGEAVRRGLRVVPGERMLLYQGVEAQRLWTGHDPNIPAMDAALRAGSEDK